MTYTHLIGAWIDSETFNDKVSDFVLNLQNDGYELIDIKYGIAMNEEKVVHSVLVIYKDK